RTSSDFRDGPLSGRNAPHVHRSTFVSDFTKVRVVLMKSSASGLSVRCRNVISENVLRVFGRSTGNALSNAMPGRFNAKVGSTERKRPVANRLLRKLRDVVMTVARGGSRPRARKASATNAWS